MKEDKILEKKKIKKSKIPYFFFAFFAVVLVVNIAYIYISKTTWRGLVTQGYYQKGVNYNDTLKEAEKQKKLGWKIKVNLREFDKQKYEIFFEILDKKYQEINDADLYVTFRRPAQEGLDFTQKIEIIDGFYQTKIQFPLKGQWDFDIVVVRGKDRFQEVMRFVIQ